MYIATHSELLPLSSTDNKCFTRDKSLKKGKHGFQKTFLSFPKTKVENYKGILYFPQTLKKHVIYTLATNPSEFWTLSGEFFCLPNVHSILSSGAAICTDSLPSILNMTVPPLSPCVQERNTRSSVTHTESSLAFSWLILYTLDIGSFLFSPPLFPSLLQSTHSSPCSPLSFWLTLCS